MQNSNLKDGTEVPTSSQTIAKPFVRGLLSSELLLSGIQMYEQSLKESKTVSARKYTIMSTALFSVKLIIANMLIDNGEY